MIHIAFIVTVDIQVFNRANFNLRFISVFYCCFEQFIILTTDIQILHILKQVYLQKDVLLVFEIN